MQPARDADAVPHDVDDWAADPASGWVDDEWADPRDRAAAASSACPATPANPLVGRSPDTSYQAETEYVAARQAVAAVPGPRPITWPNGDEHLITPSASLPLLQAAELYLSILAVVHADAIALGSDDPWNGTRAVAKHETAGTALELVGQAGLDAIGHYWDVLWPLRVGAPERSIAQCPTCLGYWYVTGGATAAPKTCLVGERCPGVPERAYKQPTPAQAEYSRTAKGKREARAAELEASREERQGGTAVGTRQGA